MSILALELSTGRGGLAWLAGDVEITREWRNDRQNSGEFFHNLEQVTRDFGLAKTIIVGLGPGSYAGTRIAISAAVGLEEASKAELIGYPSICTMSVPVDDYTIVGDARRQSFFLAAVRNRRVIGDFALHDEAGLRAELDKLPAGLPVFSSDRLMQFSQVETAAPSALMLARLAREAGRPFVRPPLQPIYLRDPHVTVPKTR